MSPSIGLMVRLPDKRPPRVRVLEALQAARIEGPPLVFSEETGVKAAAIADGWCIDRSRGVRAINAVGVLLLHFQPEVRPDEDPSAAVARELGVALAWVEGLADGWLGDPAAFWLGRSESGQLYRAGLEVGFEARGYASTVCPVCNTRRMKDEPHCPGCER